MGETAAALDHTSDRELNPHVDQSIKARAMFSELMLRGMTTNSNATST